MACRILRAPAQTIFRNSRYSSQCWSHPPFLETKHVGVAPRIQTRGYQNYKTHGEMAALKDPADGTIFIDEQGYPEILDMTSEGQLRRKRQSHYDEVKSLPTAHHKMFMINTERGREEMFYIGDLHYNSLEMYQYATRTLHKLEEPASEVGSETSNLSCPGHRQQVDPALVSLIEEIIAINDLTPVSEETKPNKKANLTRSILDIVRYHCKLTDTAVLEEPRIEAFWQHPNFKTNYDKERFEDKKTFAPWFQFAQQADLMISSETPLQPIISAESDEVFSVDFPTYDYYPEELGMVRKKHHLVSTPGYWCNNAHYPLLTTSVLNKVLPSSLDPSVSTDHLNMSERRRRLAAQGLMLNFATAVGAAFNCGFTVFHEITYPFVAQHIVTDGQIWHFSKYQLNTMAFGPDFPGDKQNFAWSSEEMKLYDSIDNGKVQGLNTTVLARIVDTVQARRAPVENPRPYIVPDVDREFLERGEKMFQSYASRKFYRNEYLHLEVPLWVKIFKMNEDAPPSPLVRWQRPKQKAPHIYQFNKEIYEAEIKEIKDRYRRITKDKFYNGRPSMNPYNIAMESKKDLL